MRQEYRNQSFSRYLKFPCESRIIIAAVTGFNEPIFYRQCVCMQQTWHGSSAASTVSIGSEEKTFFNIQ